MPCQTIVCQNYVSCVCVAPCQFGCNLGICQGNTLLRSSEKSGWAIAPLPPIPSPLSL